MSSRLTLRPRPVTRAPAACLVAALLSALLGACSLMDPPAEESPDARPQADKEGGFDNVALGRPTSQSSIAYRGDSARAVDGNTDGNWRQRSVTHTANTDQPWWRVELDGPHRVQRVTVWNRTDCCSQRLANFHVDLLDDANNVVATVDHRGQADTETSIAVSGTAVHAVRVQLHGTDPLSLAEVQVWGAPDSSVPGSQPGVHRAYYELDAGPTSMPDFDALAADSEDVRPNIDISDFAGTNAFAVLHWGFLFIEDAGTYTFQTVSDDGSLLFIDGDRVVNNDGRHGRRARQGDITLSEGYHPFVLEYFENRGGEVLELNVRRGGGDFEAVPDAMLFLQEPSDDDQCPEDPAKTAPGQCGCGTPDLDTDGDGRLNCQDGCPNDASKTSAGMCGCGRADTDGDGDGRADCADDCPRDASKFAPGACGCGVFDTDTDADGTADCIDDCPNDGGKVSPGSCGCGVSDADGDGDGTPNCNDGCPNDRTKAAAGVCGCGVADTDTDGDGIADCDDRCPTDVNKGEPGACGCTVADRDLDGDGTADCRDDCPEGNCAQWSITASGENLPREGKDRAFDDNLNTKWLTFADSAWIQAELRTASAFNRYSISSANDYPSRDPRDWRLLGSHDGRTWSVLDERAGETFGARLQTRTFQFSNGEAYRFYRLDIVSNLDPPAANSTQLSELSFGSSDGCPDDPSKNDPGVCGCGFPDLDSDGDGAADCQDECPTDAEKLEAGECGCGTPEGQCERTSPGLRRAHYTGQWSQLPDFDQLTPTAEDIADTVGLGPYAGTERFGLVFEGLIQIDNGGNYEFELGSDDGSRLFINGQSVVDNDGLHGFETVTGAATLSAGQHALRVEFFERSGGDRLRLRYRPAGGAFAEIPAARLFHRAGTRDECPNDPNKTTRGLCGCGVPEGTCEQDAIHLPIEVLGPSGTDVTVGFTLDGPVDDITHLLVTCHACGYNNHALDSDPARVKAAVRVNGGAQVALKYYTLGDDGVVGNRDIELLWQDDYGYGGIGGAFRTNRLLLPIAGLRAGANTLTFSHVNGDSASIGFRIVDLNLLRGDDPEATVLGAAQFTQEDPRTWSPARAVGTSDASTVAAAIAEGRQLWYRRNHLYDRALDELDGRAGGTAPLDGNIQASCSDCHAEDGRDLAYFNYSDHSIVERAFFHGVPRDEGRKIAAYIRSLGLPVVTQASPWNPPYQPGPGLDDRPAYEWAAGAGIDAVLDSDADMERYLFPAGTSSAAVREVVDRFGTLNMRELPVAVQMPDWGQWLPPVHPSDAFDGSDTAVRQDAKDRNVGMPFTDYLYERAASDPSPRNLGDIAERLEKWLTRGGNCYTQNVTRGPGWRTTNGKVVDALKLGDHVRSGVGESECRRIRHDRQLNAPLDLAKRGLIAWASVKQWEIIHSNDLETRSATLTEPVCIGGRCVDASEPRGWVTTDRHDVGTNVFNRAPHYTGFNARQFMHQTRATGEYENSIWYHLQMVLNSGYRRTGPNHYIYTIDHLQYMQRYTGVSQSFRFWAGMIKMRQSQTTGLYGPEHGLEPHSAQPYRMYSDQQGDTRVRAGVGSQLWRRIAEAMLRDFAQDASRGDWSDAMDDGDVQDANSRDFDLCSNCFDRVGSPHPFTDRDMLGRNTARVIPRFRELGVSESVLDALIDWGESTWRFGPWDELRAP